MELKDAILQTLAEIDEAVKLDTTAHIEKPHIEKPIEKSEQIVTNEVPIPLPEPLIDVTSVTSHTPVCENFSSERIFLSHAKDRLLVLFEGLNTPGMCEVEAKLDLTLNFLEYLLASIDERLEKVDA